MDVLKRIPVREQDAKERATNFKEVCLGYNKEEAMEEASRCINCKNAQCVKGCPVAIQIPQFIEQVKNGNIEEAYRIISESSALPAVCGRVCPQESQCEGKCIRGFKGENRDLEVCDDTFIEGLKEASDTREIRSPSVSWSVLWLTGQERMASSPLPQHRRTVRR